MRRLRLLLALFAGQASAETLNFENVLTIVPCTGYTLTHYANGVLQYKCPSGFKINWPCAHPVVSAPAPGDHRIAC